MDEQRKNSGAMPTNAVSEQEKNALAVFRVCVTSVNDATWQGVVETADGRYEFKSELQLLRWLTERFPALRPDADWEP